MAVVILIVVYIIVMMIVFKCPLISKLKNKIKAIMPKIKQGRNTMKDRISALTGIGKNARKITTEIGGNFAICVSTEAARKKKNICVYESAKRLSFTPGAIHSRKLVASFPYTSEASLVEAHKEALRFIAKKQGKICTEVGDEITCNHNGKTVKAKVTHIA